MTSSVTGIPTMRISEMFIRQRLLAQVQSNQADLFGLQTQLSTGHRFEVPGEDPVAAQRVMSLQQLLERKSQIKSNLATNKSYLSATDSALSSVSGLLAEVRGQTIGVIGTTATDLQRETAAQQADRAIQQLLDTSNQQFRGRYLLAGSRTATQPFSTVRAGLIEYRGNEEHLDSYSDINLLFETNVTGDEVFGAISQPVRGTAILRPVLTPETRLADLLGGVGISRGSIEISDGQNTSVVDLSQAETIGDVAALIKANPPSSRALDVDITAHTLVIRLANPQAGDNLSIHEVGSGTTADELGILRESGAGNQPIESRSLDPTLRGTTPIAGLLGAHARATVHSAGADNDFIVTADVPGEETSSNVVLNGVTIELVNDNAVTAGNEVVHYDAAAKKIVVSIDAGYTLASQVVAKINTLHDPVDFPFTAALDPLDDVRGGQGWVTAGASAVTRDGAGESFDKDSGLRIVNKDGTFDVKFSSAQTVEDVLNLLNGSGAGVLAEINQTGTGIDLRSRISGADFMIGENGGRTAAQLGLRTFTDETRLEDLNFGRGVQDWPGYGGGAGAGADFFITRADGVRLAIDIAGATTIGDVLDRINENPGNTGPGVVAQLATYGNGIELVDRSEGSGQLTVTRADLSTAAIDLGLVPAGATDSAEASAGTPATAVVPSTARKSGLVFTAKQAGTAMNGVRVIFDSTLPPGPPVYSDTNKTLTFPIAAGTTTAADIRNAIVGTPLEDVFSIDFDPADTSLNDGSGAVAPSAGNVMTVGTDGKAAVGVKFPNPDNDLTFRGNASLDGTVVEFVAGGAIGQPPVITHIGGSLRITYDSVSGTTAQQVVDAFVGNAEFQVTLDPQDASPNNGLGKIDANQPGGVALAGGGQTITGSDVHPLETESVFTALLRIRDGLRSNDVYEVQRSLDLLDRKVTDMNFSRAELGARQQGLEVLTGRLESENIELQDALSNDYDVPLEQVISELTARQLTYQASLQATAQTFRMSLLDYL